MSLRTHTPKQRTTTLGTALTMVLVCSAGSAYAEPIPKNAPNNSTNNAYQIAWGVIATNYSPPKAASKSVDDNDSNQPQEAALLTAIYPATYPAIDPMPYSTLYSNGAMSPNKAFSVKKARSGLNRHKLTDGRSLIGWRLSESLYFGHAKKDPGAVSLVWKTSTEQQVSLSTQGVKLTRRVK